MTTNATDEPGTTSVQLLTGTSASGADFTDIGEIANQALAVPAVVKFFVEVAATASQVELVFVPAATLDVLGTTVDQATVATSGFAVLV